MKQTPHKQPADIQARQQALDPTRSFAVSAPAGSGKTEMLTQRVLSLLAHCEQPEEILAITFTRKAAGEMQHRIIDALQKAQRNETLQHSHEQQTRALAEQALARDQQQQWQLLDNPNRLRIQTIDGFCRWLSKQQPVSSQLGTLPDTLDEHSTHSAMQQAVRESLLELQAQHSSSQALANILAHIDNDVAKLERFVISMLHKRDQWLEHLLNLPDAAALQQSNQLLVEHILQQTFTSLERWHPAITLAYDYAFENLNSNPDLNNPFHAAFNGTFPQPVVAQLPAWRDLMHFLLTGDASLRKSLDKRIGVPVDTSEQKQQKKDIVALFSELRAESALADTLALCQRVPDHPITEQQLSILQDIKALLLRTVAHLKLIFSQQQATDYIEISQAALSALGDSDAPTDLSLKLEYRIKHILVDEFQDTSKQQLQLLEKLTAGWQGDDGHSLFIVGDGMQSCYSFRNADVRIFLEAWRYGVGQVPITPLNLTENFRSRAGVVNWINATFGQAFPDSDNINLGAVSYSPSTAFDESPDSNNVQCFAFIDDEQQFHSSTHVVNTLQALRQQHPQDSIAILVRSRNQIQPLLPALQQSGLAWQATEMDKLNQRMAIIDLLSLSRALLNPTDRLAWLALLRSPVIGLPLTDLYTVATENSGEVGQTIYSRLLNRQFTTLSESSQNILQRSVNIIEQALAQRYRKPLRQWLEGLWYNLGGPATLPANQLEDCEHFFNLLESFSNAGQIHDWPAFERALERLYADKSSDENTDFENSIQIMTIHKAKGLEFDHVILPGLTQRTRGDDKEILLWNEYFLNPDQQQLVLSPPAIQEDDEDSLYHFLREEKKQKDYYESTRLLYVAATRAVKQLYLYANLQTNRQGKIVAPAKTTLLHSIWPSFEQQMLRHDTEGTEEENTQENRATPALRHIRRLPPDWQVPKWPEGQLLANYRGSEVDDEENLPEWIDSARIEARHIGTVVHHIMEQITLEGLELQDAQTINQQQPLWRYQLQQLGISERRIDYCLQRITTIIERLLQSEQARWMLDNNHAHSYCEFELYYRGQLHIIDRTFIAKDSTAWIIDYKSASPQDGQDINEFLNTEVTRYRSQLEQYARLMQQWYRQLPPDSAVDIQQLKTALYFPAIDRLEIVA